MSNNLYEAAKEARARCVEEAFEIATTNINEYLLKNGRHNANISDSVVRLKVIQYYEDQGFVVIEDSSWLKISV